MGTGIVVSRMIPAGTALWNVDSALNDSDKTYTVPANKQLYLRGVRATLAASATVGNRTLYLRILNDVGAEVWSGGLSAAITAGGAGQCAWIPGGSGLSGAAVYNAMPIPEMVLPAGYQINVKDSAAVDAAADDMAVIIHGDLIDV